MVFANFVTKSSVEAVLPEQQPTFRGVLYWAKLMLSGIDDAPGTSSPLISSHPVLKVVKVS